MLLLQNLVRNSIQLTANLALETLQIFRDVVYDTSKLLLISCKAYLRNHNIKSHKVMIRLQRIQIELNYSKLLRLLLPRFRCIKSITMKKNRKYLWKRFNILKKLLTYQELTLNRANQSTMK